MITADQLVARTRQRQAQASASPDGWALWGTGFRPFFIMAAAAAVFLVPWWVLGLMGAIPVGSGHCGVTWHAHEMLFGFALAVVAGFLLTAVPKWTSTRPLSGKPLAALAGLWLAGRLALGLSGWLPDLAVALVDLAFLPALAVAIGRPLLATGNKRNYLFIGLLAVMTLANLAYHLEALGLVTGAAPPAMRGVVDVVVVMMVVVGGRVLPMFTRNGLARVGVEVQTRAPGLRDQLAIAAVIALIPLDLFELTGAVGWVSLVAGALVASRLWGWAGSRTAGVPLLWILHIGYAWIALGLALRAVALLVPGSIPPTAALHALTAGAMGSLILGMIARVSLGHTGRELKANPIVAVSFGLIVLCGVVRVGLPALDGSLWMAANQASAILWAAAFAIFLLVYTPWLLAPRPDGAPG